MAGIQHCEGSHQGVTIKPDQKEHTPTGLFASI
jgi:hypothetical protein